MTVLGQEYLVSCDYIHPVGIGEALHLVQEYGAFLPTPDMVDDIYRQGFRIPAFTEAHDGSYKAMNSRALLDRHNAKINAAIDAADDTGLGLYVGHCKDIIQLDGKVGLYGWHGISGKPIQQPYFRHGLDWEDYSQGLRIIKRVECDDSDE